MNTSQIKYAIDLSNEGVALWHRDEEKQWVLLGKVSLDAPNFTGDVERLKNDHIPQNDDPLIARVRIPRSEVFVSKIDLTGDAYEKQLSDFLTEKTPYTFDELFYDLEHTKDGETSYVAAVTKQTIAEAKEFITAHGFHAAYYTAKFDKADFPRDARFQDGTPLPVMSAEPVPVKEPETPSPEKAPEVAPIPTPPTPKPVIMQVKDDVKDTTETPEQTGKETSEVVEPPVVEKTDFSAFETVRRKELVAPKKHGDKKEPTLPKVDIPKPTPRLSIGITDADAKRPPEKTIGLTAGTLKMPQGKTAKSRLRSQLKPRHYIILIAALLIALGYWFLTTLFDGKEEIARLNEQPAQEEVVVTAPETVETPSIVSDTPTDETTVAEVETSTPSEDVFAEAETVEAAPVAGDTPTDEATVAEVETSTPSEGVVSTVEETPVDVSPEELTDAETEIAQTVTDDSASEAANEAVTATEELAEAIPEETAEAPEVIAETTPEEQPAEPTVAPEVVSTEEEPTELAVALPEAPEVETPIVAEAAPEVAEPETPLADLIPTKDGTLGAEGITLFAGVPDIIPPVREQLKISPDPLKDILPRMRSADFAEIHKAEIEAAAALLAEAEATPETVETETPVQEDVAAIEPTEPVAQDAPQTPDLLALADPALRNKQPRVRPAIIAERVKEIAAAALAPPADPELADLKPRRRPNNLRIVKEEVQPEQVDPNEIQVAIQEAVRDIARPRARPSNLSRKVANLQAQEKANEKRESVQTAALTPRTARGSSKPSSTTAASVQRQATERGGVNKRRMSLIGVYGKASNRRALVRMPSGRYVKVQSGQKFNGWNVAAIGESSVRITKGSRNQVLRMPKN